MTTPTQPLLITAREAGRLLACSPQTVKRLAERGDLRLIRFGPGVTFTSGDVTSRSSSRRGRTIEMAGLRITAAQGLALADKLGIDPRDLDEAELLRQAAELAARAKRSVAYEDTTGIIRITPEKRSYADDHERSLADQWDDYLGIREEDRVCEFSDPDDGLPHDPTGGLLRLRV